MGKKTKLYLVNTTRGLVPADDRDYEKKAALKLGETYLVTIDDDPRNYDHHKKYFSMIDASWHCLPGYVQESFISKEGFRKSCEIAAGHCERVWSISLQGYIEQAKSVSYEELGERKFSEVYLNVRRVIDEIVTRYITPEEFEELLMNY